METVNYINTTNRCVFLFVSFHKTDKTFGGDGIFRVLLKSESQLITEEVVLNGSEVYNNYFRTDQNWLRIYRKLPDGLHKVILRAEQYKDANSFMVDDIDISHCSEIRKFLKSLILINSS